MITAENRVGRLIESRFLSPITLDEITAFEAARNRIAVRLGEQRVTVIDVSRVTILPPQLIDPLIESMRNKGTVRPMRSAMLMGTSPTVALQMARLNRETDRATRRTFTDPRELEAWVGEVLDPLERARLGEFLAGR
jgi:hypothetical protein